MTEPVFATKWDFLYAWVLIGIDRSTGVWAGSESQGADMVCVWTSDEIASQALHVESWEIKQIKVRDLLAMLPAGVGVIIDPERASGMTCPPSYVANLKRYVAQFPADTDVRLSEWDGLLATARDALVAAAAEGGLVRELYAFAYTIDDSPRLGCLAYVSARQGPATREITAALDAALATTAEPKELGVPTVSMLAFVDLPDRVQAALGEQQVIYRRKRSGIWRR
jgi:hypothetical protein